MKTLALAVVLIVALAGCGHVPKADPTGVPPPWPAPSAPVKSTPSSPSPSETPEPPRPNEKPVVPPLKRELLPQPAAPPQT